MEWHVWEKTACLVAGLAAFGLADNPLSNYHYLADPAAFATEDEFYILTDTDDECPNTGENDYTIRSLYILSSKDMKNWTDHGMVLSHEREVSYIKNIWAPGIAVDKNGVFYLIYPNGGGAVGIVTSKNVAGPYHDPVGKHLVGSGGVMDCDGISWCFDPAIFIDDDEEGTAYMTFGGGNNTGTGRTYGNNFDLIKFSKLSYDEVALDVSSRTSLKGANRSFEASYIHKRNGIYYLSYNDQGQSISYATSTNIKGPYTYKAVFIENPAKINDKGGNNHHGVAKFKDKWYAVYHDRRLVMASDKPKLSFGDYPTTTGNHRSTSIDELEWIGDSMKVVKFTDEGPTQIDDFDPYQPYKAITSSKQKNIRSRTDYTAGEPVTHVLTPYASKESWIRVSGIDFGKGAKSFRITGASVADGNRVEIHTGSASGPLAGTCDIKKTGNWKSYEDNECEVTGLSGKVDQLFIVFKGTADSTMGLIEWEFVGEGGKTPDTPQSNFGGKKLTVPGKIQAEDFDVPGIGRKSDLKSYYDLDTQNHSCTDEEKLAECSNYREDTPVDIYKKADESIVVGHNQEGEWLEYTVDVKKAGDYTMFALVATDNNNAGFSMELDGKTLVEKVDSMSTGSFDTFKLVQRNVHFDSVGQHILRMTVIGSWFDVDYFTFVEGKDATDSEPKIEPDQGDSTVAIKNLVKLNVEQEADIEVFDLHGNKVASFRSAGANGKDVQPIVRNLVKTSGVYLLRKTSGGAVQRISVTK